LWIGRVVAITLTNWKQGICTSWEKLNRQDFGWSLGKLKQAFLASASTDVDWTSKEQFGDSITSNNKQGFQTT
jgi:hypothetical protein